MNWDFIGWKVFQIFTVFAAILACFHASQWYIKYARRRKRTKASLTSKIAYHIEGILLSAFIAGIVQRDFHNPYFSITFIVTVLPLQAGLLKAFDRDAKLTVEQRQKIQYELEKPSYNSDY